MRIVQALVLTIDKGINMSRKILITLILFAITISLVACLNGKGDRATSNTSVPTSSISQDSTNWSTFSDDDRITISIGEISNILSTKNSDVIKLLGISDLDQTQYIGDERFYIPLFCCKKSGIYICFDGAPFDSIEKIKQTDGKPYEIIPIDGTTIDFGNDRSFNIGDDIQLFKSILGEGTATSDWNLKGDKKISFLTYNINNLTITIKSLNGDNFKKYMMDITKQN